MKIEGELTYANANARWQALAREAVGVAEIDCSGVTRLDSAGLAVLTSLRSDHLEGKSGGSVPTRRLIHPTPDIVRLATAYDVAALFE